MNSDQVSSTTRLPILVDAHVHLYAEFDSAQFLNSARHNFDKASRTLSRSQSASGVLMMTDTHKSRGFEHLRTSPPAGWTAVATDEEVSVRLVPDVGEQIIVIAGRQVVSSEGVEVLALGTTDCGADGLPLRETLKTITATGALALLPWGFGKWLGKRASLLKAVLDDTTAFPTLFVGDSANRPSFWPKPKLLNEADNGGRLSLPGTDPLPLTSDAGRVGRFGFVADVDPGTQHPFTKFKEWATSLHVSPPTFGARDGTAEALRRQLALRIG